MERRVNKINRGLAPVILETNEEESDFGDKLFMTGEHFHKYDQVP